jgi:predicted PurR-regulated permease PerM
LRGARAKPPDQARIVGTAVVAARNHRAADHHRRLPRGVVTAEQSFHVILIVRLAWLFAIAMEPAVAWFVRHRVRRGVATGFTLLGLLILIVAFAAIFGPLLVSQLVALVKALPGFVDTAVAWANGHLGSKIDPGALVSNLHLSPGQVANFASQIAGGPVGIVGSLVGLVFSGFTILLFAFYLSAEAPRGRTSIGARLNPSSQQAFVRVWDIAVAKTGGFVVSRLLLALLSTIFAGTFLFTIGVSY